MCALNYVPQSLESLCVNSTSQVVCIAGVQKNIGPAGLAIAIVREDLLGSPRAECPTMCDYTTMAESDSMYNTPPCWSVYVCGLVFKKLLADGGLSAMEERNNAKVHICSLFYCMRWEP